MRRPSRQRRLTGWSGPVLAGVAALAFAGIGAWEYQHWQEQQSQGEQRTSRLIACLETAERAVDTTAATNACAVQYADRVPALLESNPYALVPRPATASESSLLGDVSPRGSSAPRPTLSSTPSHATEPAITDGTPRSDAGPVEPLRGSGPDVGAARPTTGPPRRALRPTTGGPSRGRRW